MRARHSVLWAVLIAVAGTACAPRRKPVVVPPPPGPSYGIASWYGPGFHGKKTASGEVFDQNALTAAHCCWPLGLRVRVTFLSTGRSVVVRINDRMPPNKKGRVLDLSRAAARLIGLVGPGTGRVQMDVLGRK
jgi:rare lipoprotein A